MRGHKFRCHALITEHRSNTIITYDSLLESKAVVTDIGEGEYEAPHHDDVADGPLLVWCFDSGATCDAMALLL